MESLAHAARVIDGTSEPHGVDALLHELGFAAPRHSLSPAVIERLGLPASIVDARVSLAEGTLRALTVAIPAGGSIRDSASVIARQLCTRAPHLLWLLVITQRDSGSLGIATWRCTGSNPRIVAIVTERRHVVDSDAETLCALSGASTVAGDVMRHMRWLDILGRDGVTRRFFHALSAAVDALAHSIPPSVPEADSRELALITTSRLLFLSFLETKGWLNGDFGFLANGFTACMTNGGNYQRRVLEPLFFGTLNTRVSERAPRARGFGRVPFLNGGLFARTSLERIHRRHRLTDDALGELFGDVLVRYRFTAREDAAAWSQAAIDPEMLGKVFESLMDAGERKRGGVFYTPQHFVEKITHDTLGAKLQALGVTQDDAERLLDPQENASACNAALLRRVASLRVLDPACGSGAFLVHALERLSQLRVTLGDTQSLSDIRRKVLMGSIFGVDSNPTAVWLCELRLWLSAVIDSDERDAMCVAPLPNLDRQIRIGDSLSGDSFAGPAIHTATSRRVAELRGRYSRSSGQRKLSLGRQLDSVERGRAVHAIGIAITSAECERREIIRAARSRDLFDERRSPAPPSRDRLKQLRSALRLLKRRRTAIGRGASPAFTYPTHFSDVADAGGFDLVIGNPPWIRMHNMPADDRARLRDQFRVFRSGGWAEGAHGAHAGRGFAGQIDVAALFIERSMELLGAGGALGLLLPAKLWRSLAGGGVRRLLIERTDLRVIEDHSEAPTVFDAAVYPSILIATRKNDHNSAENSPVRVVVQHAAKALQCTIDRGRLPLDSTPGSPWLLLPHAPRKSFDALRSAGTPLFESILGRPYLGVKTGCNEAFVVSAGRSSGATLTPVSRDARRGDIESSMLRPLVRGETITPWRLSPNDEHIVWTHDEEGQPLRELPREAHRWLIESRRSLERRTDLRSEKWWSLFRTESAEYVSPRVIWADFGRTPRAAVVDAGDPTVPLNSCYAIKCPSLADAFAFAALLNSRIVAAWLAAIAEPARGGYHRYLGWTIAQLPIPVDWPRARALLAPLASAARDGSQPNPCELDSIVLDAYKLHSGCLQPLLNWMLGCQDA